MIFNLFPEFHVLKGIILKMRENNFQQLDRERRESGVRGPGSKPTSLPRLWQSLSGTLAAACLMGLLFFKPKLKLL